MFFSITWAWAWLQAFELELNFFQANLNLILDSGVELLYPRMEGWVMVVCLLTKDSKVEKSYDHAADV